MKTIEFEKKQTEIIINLVKAQLFDEVINKTLPLIKKFPGNYIFFNALSIAYINKKKYSDSLNVLQTILKKNEKNIFVLNNLGLTHYYLENFSAARDYFNRALKENPNFLDSIMNLANVSSKLNNNDDAISILIKALGKYESNFFLHYTLGALYQTKGDFQKSNYHLEKSIELNPNYYESYRALSLSKKFDENDNKIKFLKEKILDPQLSISKKVSICFTLGKYFDDLKNYKESFKYYHEANNLKSKLTNYNFNKDIEQFNRIKEIFKDSIKENLKPSDKKIIFILGMPRSGTSLIEQIISSHSKVYGAGELNFLTDIISTKIKNNDFQGKNFFENLSKIKEEYNKKISEFKFNEIFITDKAPLNFKWIGFINHIFPNSKIINCKRNSMDTCWSNYKQFFSSQALSFSYDLEKLSKFHNLYEDYMKFWNIKFKEKILEVEYEKITKNIDQEVKRILEFCELNWEQSCIEFYKNKHTVSTASLAQVRKPIYKTSVKAWENYSQFLEVLTKNLQK